MNQKDKGRNPYKKQPKSFVCNRANQQKKGFQKKVQGYCGTDMSNNAYNMKQSRGRTNYFIDYGICSKLNWAEIV